MRILIPVDGSTPSRSVLQFVSDRAKQMPVMPVVQLLTVEPPVPSSGIGTMMELEAVRSAFAAEGERVLESLLPIAGGIPLYRAVVYGRPGEEIANASDTFCADLIAMGTHGRRGVSRLFIGSTSHSVLALVERPLLFINRNAISRTDRKPAYHTGCRRLQIRQCRSEIYRSLARLLWSLPNG